MSTRRYFLDRGIGESRAVVTLGGRSERLMIVREQELQIQAMGARVAARVRAVDRGQGLAFLDLGHGPDAALNLSPDIGPVSEGGWVDVEIRTEARAGKGASARWLGPAEGPLRLLASPPDLAERLAQLSKGARIETGPAARKAADTAQDEALETIFPLPGGGGIAVEPTRALIAVDVDVGARAGEVGKRLARAANLAALAEAARVLRLKGLGGLVVIDLAGRGHDGAALLGAARAAFAPDNPGVAFGPVSRFGTLELTIPRRARPALETLTDDGPGPSAVTLAMSLIRALEQEATTDGGGRFEAIAASPIAEAAAPYMTCLTDRFGARLSLASDAARQGFEVRAK